jgi:Na+/proline symporter
VPHVLMSLATFDEHEADTIHEHQYVNGLTQTSGLGLVTLYALLATFSMIGALTAVFWLDALTGRTFLLVVVHIAMMLPIKFIEHGVVRLGHLIPNRSISTVGLGTTHEVDDRHDHQDDNERSNTDVHKNLLSLMATVVLSGLSFAQPTCPIGQR